MPSSRSANLVSKLGPLGLVTTGFGRASPDIVRRSSDWDILVSLGGRSTMDLDLAGKVAMVAGASSGLGKAVAETLAVEGAKVSIAARSEQKLNAVARGIEEQYSAEVLSQPTDVRLEDEVDAWTRSTVERFGRIDILVANAGGPPTSTFVDTSVQTWRDAVELNLMSTIFMCGTVVPHMRRQKAGSIIAVTSVSVKQPVDGLILSNTARAGVLGLTKSMSNELAPEGIRVNMVCPGYTRTERLEDLAERLSQSRNVSSEEIYRGWTAAIPMARIGEPEEFASVVAFLASERASYVTGTCIQVDGGAVKGLF